MPIALAIAACGDAARVPADVARQLPTQEYGLSQDLCPRDVGIGPEYGAQRLRRNQRKGKRELDALERAYRDDPDAIVRATYTPADEPGIAHEDISIRELAETQLKGFDVLDGECSRRAAARLRALLG